MRIRTGNKSGVILIIVLWVLVILTVLSLSLGRGSNIELAMAKYAIGKARSKYIAWAGLFYSVYQLKQDTKDPASAAEDNLYYCGIKTDDSVNPETLFKDHKVEGGEFSIYYRQEASDSGRKRIVYGLFDEERLLNLNGINSFNVPILESLLTVLGVEQEKARTIAAAVADWQDGDDNLSDGEYGAENDYYSSLPKPYLCKNSAFNSLPELLLVKGMDKEAYSLVKNYLTVLPSQGGLKVNFNTASYPVLLALAMDSLKRTVNATEEDARSLVEKMIKYRRGGDQTEFTSDDRKVDLTETPVNAVERNIFLQMSRYKTDRSQYFRVHSQGTDSARKIKTNLTAVIDRDDNSVLYWKIN
ncbi:MAG: general secretion pathway protein GspK [Candidatus Omnitrophica bacterium]|nr:general secretion pathway protein GspK [Candidatus Omnitrophota bacterium]